MLFTGSGESFNVGAFLESISPYTWASMGIALCIGLSVVGAAWYVPQSQSPLTGFWFPPINNAANSPKPRCFIARHL